MKIYIRSSFILTFLLLIISAPTLAERARPQLKSGQYEHLMLAIDEHDHLTGFYHEEQGVGVVKSCTFYLAGRVEEDQSSVVTWSNKAFPGKLKANTDGVTLQIENGREHTGCGLVLLPEINSGLDLDRVADAEWLELRKVSMPSVHFHKSPDARSELKSYVVDGNIVSVTARKGDWLKVEYRGVKHTTKGWIPVNATVALTPAETSH